MYFSVPVRGILEDMNEKTLSFPDGFFWGTASASHQIEGHQHNNWSEWENSSKRLEELKRKHLNPADFTSELAANSWEHLDDDIACIKKLNNNAYRFSVEWSRIEPREGVFDQAAIEKYHHFIKRLKAEGIEPFVTLWHWTNPVWLTNGWENPKVIDYFARFTETFVRACPEVKFWITINEPQVITSKSYLAAAWPPQKMNPFAYLRVLNNLVKAHCQAFKKIKAINGEAKVGIAHHQVCFEGAGGPINRLMENVADWWVNRWFLNQIKGCQDFIGVNYYFHNVINYFRIGHKNRPPVSDMDWELFPEGLYRGLRDLKAYGLPLYITEHGLADEKDAHRAWYIKESLRFVKQAMDEGVDVRGYFHWSLLDNLEWSDGLLKKFGLYAINRTTWERLPRPSAAVYAEIAKTNRI